MHPGLSLTYSRVVGVDSRSAPCRPATLTEARALTATSFFESGGLWVPMMFYGVSYTTVDMCLVQIARCTRER